MTLYFPTRWRKPGATGGQSVNGFAENASFHDDFAQIKKGDRGLQKGILAKARTSCYLADMTQTPFELPQFLPYLLNQAAEAASRDFQDYYRAKYGMLRTEWRVLFHLGCYGALSAKQICEKASIHKTKVSRAVAALEDKRFLTRAESSADRRIEVLSLTPSGHKVFEDLSLAAEGFEARLVEGLEPSDLVALRRALRLLAKLDD